MKAQPSVVDEGFGVEQVEEDFEMVGEVGKSDLTASMASKSKKKGGKKMVIK
jgi:hypothetical protein